MWLVGTIDRILDFSRLICWANPLAEGTPSPLKLSFIRENKHFFRKYTMQSIADKARTQQSKVEHF